MINPPSAISVSNTAMDDAERNERNTLPFLQSSERKERAIKRWKKVKTAVQAVQFSVRSKKLRLGRETKLLKNYSGWKRELIITSILLSMLSAGVLSAETKAAVFHMSAVGLYGNGQEYPFKYVWSMTVFTFVIKVALVLMHLTQKSKKKKKKELDVDFDELEKVAQLDDEMDDDEMLVSEEIPLFERLLQYAKPISMLVLISIFDILGSTLASLSLSVGTPTSVFVVFKSAKIVFVAVTSVVILRVFISRPQWGALVIMGLGMTVAAFSENKKTSHGSTSLLGPFLLLLGELCHAIQIVLQEICVKKYMMSAGVVIGGSSIFGCIMAISACMAASKVMVPFYNVNGDYIGERPQSDIADTFAMMTNNPYLGIAFVMHIVSLALSDMAAVTLAKHVNSIARVLVDALKLMVMWFIGKFFWIIGRCVYLAEPWRDADPIIGSWMMIPAMISISYSLLMYQKGVWLPITYTRKEGWVVNSIAIEQAKKKQQVVESASARSLDVPLLKDEIEDRKPRFVIEGEDGHTVVIASPSEPNVARARMTKIGLDSGWEDVNLMKKLRFRVGSRFGKTKTVRIEEGENDEEVVVVNNNWGVVQKKYRSRMIGKMPTRNWEKSSNDSTLANSMLLSVARIESRIGFDGSGKLSCPPSPNNTGITRLSSPRAPNSVCSRQSSNEDPNGP